MMPYRAQKGAQEEFKEMGGFVSNSYRRDFQNSALDKLRGIKGETEEKTLDPNKKQLWEMLGQVFQGRGFI